MGTSTSKQSGAGPTYVWKGSSPASVSQDMIEALQSSPETDSSRAQLHEAQLQARVAAELRKLHDDESRRLAALLSQLAADDNDKNNNNNNNNAPSPISPSSTATTTTNANKNAADKSRHAVAAEIAALERRLHTRRLAADAPAGAAEAARARVVQCLRENDRRPLDCWREVQAFKAEVHRLEQGWVTRVLS